VEVWVLLLNWILIRFISAVNRLFHCNKVSSVMKLVIFTVPCMFGEHSMQSSVVEILVWIRICLWIRILRFSSVADNIPTKVSFFPYFFLHITVRFEALKYIYISLQR
jgi:hypothetical protein